MHLTNMVRVPPVLRNQFRSGCSVGLVGAQAPTEKNEKKNPFCLKEKLINF